MPARINLLLLALLVAMSQLVALATPAGAAGSGVLPNPWQERRVLNIAHRGGADELPENTLYALSESLARGVDMLETDVYMTADGELVVSHDATVDRTTNGNGAIADMTLTEVQALDAAHWYVPGRGSPHDAAESDYVFRGVAVGALPPPEGYSPTDFRVPTLREVLARFPKVPLNIELKDGPPTGASMAQAVADLLAEFSRTEDVVVASFLDQVLLEFKALAPEVHTSPATAEVATFWAAAQGSGPGRPMPQHRVFQVPMDFSGLEVVNEDFVRDAHFMGMAVHVWTVDDRPTMEYLVSIGVDGIMTDRPSLLEDVLADRGVRWVQP